MEENQEMQLVKIKNEGENGAIITTETTIQDKKEIFNLENGECDVKLNDIVGETIVVKNVFMKRIVSKLSQEEIEINEETGEIINDKKVSVVTILIDEDNVKYVTASKIFAIAMINLIRTFGIEEIQKGVEIKIIKKSIKNSPNKALSFELI